MNAWRLQESPDSEQAMSDQWSMSDQWNAVKLGDLLERVRRPVKVVPGSTYPAVSVTRDGQGLGDKDPFVGGETNYSTLFGVRTGDVVVRTITAFESPVGVARAEHDGTHVSQVFLTYEVGEDALPAYLAYVFQTPAFWWHMQNRAQGTVLRRKTISHEAFVGIPIQLPPLTVQRRIVDLMAHLDNHLASLRTERAAATLVLSRLRADVYGSGADQVRLGDLARVDRGASWSAKQEIAEGGHPVIRIANVQPEGLDLSEVRRVEGLKPRDIARSSIGEGSILLVGSNGNPERIGNAYLSDPALHGAVLASFLIGVHAESRDEAEFIWHCLCAPKVQAAITASTAGSTGLKNLSIEWLRDLGIPQPDAETRDAALALLRAANAVVMSLGAEITRLTLIRSGLLESLLERQVDISEAYDDFLHEVA